MARNYRIPTHRAFSSAFYFSARILFLKEVSKQESSTERPGPNPRAPKLFASPRAGPGLHQLLRRHVLIAYCWNPCAKHSLFARLKSLLFSWSTFTSSHCKKPLMWPLKRRTWAAHPASTAMKSSEIVATVRLIEQNYMCEFTYFSQRWKVDFPPQSLLPFYPLTTSPPPPPNKKGQRWWWGHSSRKWTSTAKALSSTDLWHGGKCPGDRQWWNTIYSSGWGLDKEAECSTAQQASWRIHFRSPYTWHSAIKSQEMPRTNSHGSLWVGWHWICQPEF